LISNKIIPYTGFDTGYNLIIYDKDIPEKKFRIKLHEIGCADGEIEMHVELLKTGGYTVLFNDRYSDILEIFLRSLLESGFQAEILHEA